MNDKAKEVGDDLKELYRKTLAAELTCQAGEPSADQVIEDIFSGGDGWGSTRDSDTASSRRAAEDTWSDGEMRGLRENKRSWPDFQRMPLKQVNRESLGKSDEFRGRARGSFGQARRPEMEKEWRVPAPELDELEVREDLRCWLSRPVP